MPPVVSPRACPPRGTAACDVRPHGSPGPAGRGRRWLVYPVARHAHPSCVPSWAGSRPTPDMVKPLRSGSRRRLEGTLAVLATAVLLLPVIGVSGTAGPAQAAGQQRGDGRGAARDGGRARDGWAARAISAGGIRARDRALLGALPPQARLGYHPGTGRVRFLSGSPRQPLAAGPAAIVAGKRRLTDSDARSRAGVSSSATVVSSAWHRPGTSCGRSVAAGISWRPPGGALVDDGPADGRSADRRSADPDSADRASSTAVTPFNVTVRFDQVRGGLPVMGGQIVVQVSAQGDVISAAGEVLPSAARVADQARASASPRRAPSPRPGWRARRTAHRPPSHVAPRAWRSTTHASWAMPSAGAAAPRLAWRIDARLPATGREAARTSARGRGCRGWQVLSSIGRIYAWTASSATTGACPGGRSAATLHSRAARARPAPASPTSTPPIG